MSNLIIVAVLVIAILCGVHVDHKSATERPLFGPVRVDTWSISTGAHDWTVWETRSYE